jgi:hypothetical protein
MRSAAAHNSLRPWQPSGDTAAPHRHSSEKTVKPLPRSDLFDTRWLELPPRPIDQKVFQDEPPLPAVQRPAAVIAFYPAMRWLRLRLRFDANQSVLRIATWTAKILHM